MKGKKILQLSVLDAVIHPRMYYKYALSFADLGFQVKVVGEKKHTTFIPPKNIEIIALNPILPTAFKRLKRQFQLWQISWQYKPDMLMIHAIELTFFAYLYKKLRPKTHVVYDVFEDFEKNLVYNPLLANWKKKIIHVFLRPLEIFFAKSFDAVCYAENCYDNILNVLPEKKYIFLNKFREHSLHQLEEIALPALPYMLYTGTLEKNWGIMETLDVWIAFNKIEPLHLVIAGFTYDQNMLSLIHEKVAKSGLVSLFTLYGGNQYVSYSQILYLIQNCVFGTGLYNLTPSIIGKIPTKFFEYLWLGKPLLFTSEPYWNELNDKWAFGIPMEEGDDLTLLMAKIKTFKASPFKQEANWEGYQQQLQALIKDL